MPELPDIELYVHKLSELLIGQPLLKLRTFTPFVLRTFDPKPADLEGKVILGFRRLGKRIVFELEDGLFVIVHLMIAGRFQWKTAVKSPNPAGKIGLATFEFPIGTLVLTEAGSKKRAGIYLVRGEAALHEHDPGGLEPLEADLPAFKAALQSQNSTVKRALTSPKIFSGIGNAYSDEILHAAKLSPMKLTSRLTDEEIAYLFEKTQSTLIRWAEVLKGEFKNKFPGPGDVTAFRPDFAVHGKYGKPCPVCGKPVQHVVFADNEMNYCAQCQNDGKLLADRAMSRLLKGDRPKTLDDLD